ncbi:MAG: hypothetical protein A2077_00015 [Nitrospirae bacterium GWC2_46_6]|nr:MAG: hypothetical protein A2077_00015 [Nitrospirae bacterium GWC2_46_6]OGW20785.1 MAG: hypothetical protein A2Z82_02060 [Nitrospirae bacterium GWA2_46_11]OGW23932.1 MAG: hypothetical protein A2X55_07375 [Nitrospirae bacterium GWB2_47_37]HAK89303.1 hypothetical protein [Nitrospiraceae bacterium]
MATVKQADLAALEIGKKFAERIHALFPDAKVLLYGSAARGEMEEFSDIDIYVEVPDAYDIETIRTQINDIAWGVGFDNDRVIQAVVYRKSDVWDTPRRSSPFIRAVHNEGVVL